MEETLRLPRSIQSQEPVANTDVKQKEQRPSSEVWGSKNFERFFQDFRKKLIYTKMNIFLIIPLRSLTGLRRKAKFTFRLRKLITHHEKNISNILTKKISTRVVR